MVIWRFSDGKQGHESQSKGLIQALEGFFPKGLRVYTFDCSESGLRNGIFQKIKELPPPALLLAAGHATHFPMLYSKWRRGGRSIVLMKPTLPYFLFDLSIVPEHDRPRKHPKVLLTRGVLNGIKPILPKDPGKGLMLIGGPCRHVHWSDEGVFRQVTALCSEGADIQWTLTTSRRTPPGWLGKMETRKPANLQVVPFESTSAGWVAGQLNHTAQVWVTSDSVSMMFEALSSGAAVGELVIDWKPDSKLKASLQCLIDEDRVVPFEKRKPGTALSTVHPPLQEAARCAGWVVEKWFSGKQNQS